MKLASLAILLLMAVSRFAAATTLTVSVSGQFSSAVTTSQLSAPKGSFAMEFSLPNTPTVANVDMFGFDTYFVGFSYQLNGVRVPVVPQDIRFSTSSNLGLFTVFFGPESGYDSSGDPIPEFSFEGPQAFSGSTSNPTILPNSYAVSSWTYSDEWNYDQHTVDGSVVEIGTAVPEPNNVEIVWPTIGGIFYIAVRQRRCLISA